MNRRSKVSVIHLNLIGGKTLILKDREICTTRCVQNLGSRDPKSAGLEKWFHEFASGAADGLASQRLR